MKTISYIIGLAILISSSIYGQGVSYNVGEKVAYTIHYGVINGGIATLENKSDTIDGKEVWHSKFLAKTTGLAEAIFKVKEIYESYIDPDTELPVKSVRNIREGRYRKYNEVLFDHTTRADSAILTSDLTGIHITQPGIHDIISCFYYFRNHNFRFSVMFQNHTFTPRRWPKSARASNRSWSRLSSTLTERLRVSPLSNPQFVNSSENTWFVKPASCARRTNASN